MDDGSSSCALPDGKAGTDGSIATDVVVVGGGPAGSAAGVFTARYGLDTLILDRGNSSIRRCAFLENYLGFPVGIDIETFYALIHDHASEMGCTIRSDLVESVERTDSGGFRVITSDSGSVEAARVVAATRYGGEYLRGLDTDDAMFETPAHGRDEDRFARDYSDRDGRTPIDGLYIASPTEGAEMQALSAAGHATRVARALVEDVRHERGFPDEIATYHDWMRRMDRGSDEETAREKLRTKLGRRLPDDSGIDDESLQAVREREIDRLVTQRLSREEIARRTERSHDRLLEHIDDERILAAAREIEAEQRSA